MVSRRPVIFCVTSLLLGSFAWSSLSGMTVLPLDLTSMTRQAEKIFVGHCQEMSSELDEGEMPSTFVRFRVLNGIKGVVDGETLLIKQFGVMREPLYVREGEKVLVPLKNFSASRQIYDPGRDYLLFLYPESVLGYTSPVGGGQGKFDVLRSPDEGQIAVNPAGNQFLKLKDRESRAGLPEGPILLDQIVLEVQKLVQKK